MDDIERRALMEQCIEDKKLKTALRRYASRVYIHLPDADFEDVVHDLWVAIFESLPRYVGTKPLQRFAMDVAYSTSGNMLKHRFVQNNLYANAIHSEFMDGLVDRRTTYQEEVLISKLTYEKIKESLETEAKKSRQFKIVVEALDGIENGDDYGNYKAVGVSSGYYRKAWHYVRKSVTVQSHR